MKFTPDEVDEEQDYITATAMSAANGATLNLSGYAIIDEDTLLQIALEDPMYWLLVSRVINYDKTGKALEDPMYQLVSRVTNGDWESTSHRSPMSGALLQCGEQANCVLWPSHLHL